MRLLPLLFVLIPSALLAQRKSQPASLGSVEGDVYLVMQSGDAKRAPGQTLFLLRDTPALRLDLENTCQLFRLRRNLPDQYIAALEDSVRRADNSFTATQLQKRLRSLSIVRDSAVNRMISEVFDTFKPNVIDTTSSGVAAHYRFTDLGIGNYVVFGQWTFSDKLYQWFAPFAIRGPKAIVRDLDNSVEASKSLGCNTGK